MDSGWKFYQYKYHYIFQSSCRRSLQNIFFIVPYAWIECSSAYTLCPDWTACLSGAAKLARRQDGDKNASAVVFLSTFFFLSYTKLTATERGELTQWNFKFSALLRQSVIGCPLTHFMSYKMSKALIFSLLIEDDYDDEEIDDFLDDDEWMAKAVRFADPQYRRRIRPGQPRQRPLSQPQSRRRRHMK